MQGEEANVLVVEILIKICTAANIRKLIELAILKCAHRAWIVNSLTIKKALVKYNWKIL